MVFSVVRNKQLQLVNLKIGILIFFIGIIGSVSFAQSKDSSKIATVTKPTTSDSIVKPNHNPRLATRRSLIIPGWGQAYNREYWKIPIVYGVLAIPTYTYIFNTKYYKMTKFAYSALYAATYNKDSTQLQNIDPEIRERVINGTIDLATLQNARNAYRKNREYSIFWFIIAWGVNVADATVFGHLKNFDVSNNLSLHIEPTLNPATRSPGISLVLNFKTPKKEIRTLGR